LPKTAWNIKGRYAMSGRTKFFLDTNTIIAATALILDATLLTNDTKLFNKNYPGLKSAGL
jgi:predicted nucleic acid-binding protein